MNEKTKIFFRNFITIWGISIAVLFALTLLFVIGAFVPLGFPRLIYSIFVCITFIAAIVAGVKTIDSK